MHYRELVFCLRAVAEGIAEYLSDPERPGAAARLRTVLATTRPFLVKSNGYEPDVNAMRAIVLKKCDEVALAIQRSHLQVVTIRPARYLTRDLCDELLGLVSDLVPELAARTRCPDGAG